MKWILIIIWFVGGQSPAQMQIEFTSQETCSKAAANLALEFSRKQSRAELAMTCVER
jgi:hypothetical protein